MIRGESGLLRQKEGYCISDAGEGRSRARVCRGIQSGLLVALIFMVQLEWVRLSWRQGLRRIPLQWWKICHGQNWLCPNISERHSRQRLVVWSASRLCGGMMEGQLTGSGCRKKNLTLWSFGWDWKKPIPMYLTFCCRVLDDGRWLIIKGTNFANFKNRSSFKLPISGSHLIQEAICWNGRLDRERKKFWRKRPRRSLWICLEKICCDLSSSSDSEETIMFEPLGKMWCDPKRFVDIQWREIQEKTFLKQISENRATKEGLWITWRSWIWCKLFGARPLKRTIGSDWVLNELQKQILFHVLTITSSKWFHQLFWFWFRCW